jgi:nucleotide-binding universal stress UspA family protein
MYRKVLVPTDGSEFAQKVLVHARQMAALAHADVVVLQVVEGSDGSAVAPRASRAAAERNVRGLTEALRYDDGAVSAVVRGGDPARTIVQTARSEDADLIVMATHGGSGYQRAVLGSVADYVARNAQCPVLPVTAHRGPQPD